MTYKIAGGIFLALLGFSMCGVHIIPAFALGVIGVVAGVALLAGL